MRVHCRQAILTMRC